MKVAYVASESVPYASTGGLGDVAHSLPRALRRRGLEVRCILPLHRRAWEGGFPLADTGLRLRIPVGFRILTAEIWRHEGADPEVYFVRRDEFFDRREIYSLPERDYDDNFERFIFFQKAVVGLLDVLDFRADIVHCNDWQTALVPLFLRHGPQGLGRTLRERTVMTLHNIVYQGRFPASDFALTNLPFSCFSVNGLEYYGEVNCLKGGILAADRVNTVSRSYADEIRTEALGAGLAGVLRSIGDRLIGIPNGADYEDWNPATDARIARTYGPEDVAEGKAACRRALCREIGFEPGRAPLLSMISRLVDDKGLDLLAAAMPSLMARDVRFVLLGSGQERWQAVCREWAGRWPERCSVTIGFNSDFAHRILAGSDLFLMPSRQEPCGLSQLYALKYGTLPIVHAVGGLKDTVRDLSPDAAEGFGFSFAAYQPEALLAALDRALEIFGRPDLWAAARRRAMAEDYSWEKSAAAYEDLYRAALASDGK